MLLLAAYVCVLRKDRIYPAMRAYLLVNAIGGILVCTLLGLPGLLAGSESTVYYALFWVAYGASGVLTFFTAQQIFRDALEPLPGLRRLALVAFRWVAVVSVALSVVPAIVPLFFRAHSLQITVLQAMRCVSVLEFCLVAFHPALRAGAGHLLAQPDRGHHARLRRARGGGHGLLHVPAALALAASALAAGAGDGQR